MVCKIKKSWLLLVGLVFITCNNSEEQKEIPLEIIKKKDTTLVVKAEVIKKELLVFKVQIAALKLVNESFSNLEGIAISQENGLTKYRLGSFDTYKEAREYRNRILKTYKDAFVQALKNEVPVSILEAIEDSVSVYP
jgi:aromatic ring-opening dioxygenase LigB subunit